MSKLSIAKRWFVSEYIAYPCPWGWVCLSVVVSPSESESEFNELHYYFARLAKKINTYYKSVQQINKLYLNRAHLMVPWARLVGNNLEQQPCAYDEHKLWFATSVCLLFAALLRVRREQVCFFFHFFTFYLCMCIAKVSRMRICYEFTI